MNFFIQSYHFRAKGLRNNILNGIANTAAWNNRYIYRKVTFSQHEANN